MRSKNLHKRLIEVLLIIVSYFTGGTLFPQPHFQKIMQQYQLIYIKKGKEILRGNMISNMSIWQWIDAKATKKISCTQGP